RTKEMKSRWNWGSITCIMSNRRSGPLHAYRKGGGAAIRSRTLGLFTIPK
uniref:Uncharacterized protein n=1 Tax=Hucho hucho TaxID=62062 RepID=A0A4W5JM07_9TELE